MSVKLTYDEAPNILTIKIIGTPSLDDFKNVFQKIMFSSDFPYDVNTLWDISEMDFETVDIEFEQALVEMRKPFNQQRGEAKIAIYSNYKLGEPLVKLFLILAKDISQAMRAFTTLDETRSWLME